MLCKKFFYVQTWAVTIACTSIAFINAIGVVECIEVQSTVGVEVVVAVESAVGLTKSMWLEESIGVISIAVQDTVGEFSELFKLPILWECRPAPLLLPIPLDFPMAPLELKATSEIMSMFVELGVSLANVRLYPGAPSDGVSRFTCCDSWVEHVTLAISRYIDVPLNTIEISPGLLENQNKESLQRPVTRWRPARLSRLLIARKYGSKLKWHVQLQTLRHNCQNYIAHLNSMSNPVLTAQPNWLKKTDPTETNLWLARLDPGRSL